VDLSKSFFISFIISLPLEFITLRRGSAEVPRESRQGDVSSVGRKKLKGKRSQKTRF